MFSKECMSCGRIQRFGHYEECLLFQTEDLEEELKEFCLENDDLVKAVQTKAKPFCEAMQLTWDKYLDHSHVLEKGLDRVGLDLVGYGLVEAGEERTSSDEKQAFLDAVLYVQYIYNQNSIEPLDCADVEKDVDVNGCANVLFNVFETDHLPHLEPGEWGADTFGVFETCMDPDYLTRLKTADYAGFVNVFGKILFCRLYDQIRIHERRNLCYVPWLAMALRLLVMYEKRMRANTIIAMVDGILGW